jgi:hypothetical protein
MNDVTKTPVMTPGASSTPIGAGFGGMYRATYSHGGNVAGGARGPRNSQGSRANALIPSGSPSKYDVFAGEQPPNSIADVDIDSNWFSPFQPVTPFGPPYVNWPRSYDYPVGANVDFLPRLGVFSTLRTMAQSWGLLRTVIETRKDQLLRMPWTIRLKDKPNAKDKRIDELHAFLRRPDRKHHWGQWARMLLEDKFVIDAASIYVWPAQGGKPYALQVLDGATIKPLIDDAGRRPDFPSPAYQQVIKGLPLINLTENELIYAPQRPRPQLPMYGYSEVEQIMIEIMEGLQKQVYKTQFWREGSMPDLLITAPKDWRPEQIASFQVAFDALLSGNLNLKSKVRFVPSEMKPYDIKNSSGEALHNQEDEWLARLVCFCFSVSPQPFVHQMNRATAETAQEVAEEEGLHPLMGWFADEVMNPIVQEPIGFGYDDLEFAWLPQPSTDEAKQMTVLTGYVKAGIKTINEARDQLNLAPDKAGGELIVETANGPTPLQETIEANRQKALAVPDQIAQQKAATLQQQQGATEQPGEQAAEQQGAKPATDAQERVAA